jgi:hypothetical protein
MGDDALLSMRSPPETACERSMDLMLLEALLIKQRPHKVGTASTPLCAVNLHTPTGVIHSPMLLRSEAEKLIGQELIKALSDFKQLVIAPFSPNNQECNSSVKESFVEHPMDTRGVIGHRRTKINYRKPFVKVVRDMLTKKWVFIRKNKKLSARPLVMIRREEEQLTGHVLFKAQTNPKVSSVPSLSPSSGHELKQWLYLRRPIIVCTDKEKLKSNLKR